MFIKEDLDWRAKEDARVLAEAENIKMDKTRYSKAVRSAKELAHERLEDVQGILNVAGMKNMKSRKYSNPATIGKL